MILTQHTACKRCFRAYRVCWHIYYPPDRAPETQAECDCANHEDAIFTVFKFLTDEEFGVISELNQINAVGHRIVHGGELFKKSVLVDDKVINAIDSLSSLAPLHNPPNLAGITAIKSLLPDVPQVAVFDTAFHQTMPPAAYLYAIL